MIYQNDNYAFVLSLTRKTTTILVITGVTYNPSISPYAVYTYSLESGPYPTIQNRVVITGMSHSGNNGSFVIISMSELVDSLGITVGGTFNVLNTTAVTSAESGIGTIGTLPNVTTPPVVQIVRVSDFTAMLSVPAYMNALDSSNQVWIYTWNVGPATSGDYIAIVSYAADGSTFSGMYLDRVRVGDTYILGTLALDGTVAKDSTVAKDATVAHSSDLSAINPDNSTTILSIKSKTDNLPSDPAGMTLLSSVIQGVADIHDATLGSQVIDKTQNPALYTMKRQDESILAQFTLSDDSSATSRTAI
jgi:hypothetical protein